MSLTEKKSPVVEAQKLFVVFVQHVLVMEDRHERVCAVDCLLVGVLVTFVHGVLSLFEEVSDVVDVFEEALQKYPLTRRGTAIYPA